MDSIKLMSFVTIVLLLFSCKDESSTDLIIKETYGLDSWEKQGLIKGNLHVAGESEPLYSNLSSDNTRTIVIIDLIEGTYRFEYFVKPDGNEYWPVPKDTVFQIRDGETLTLELK